MADIRPFRAYRPARGYENRIPALPYDVMSSAEAREIGGVEMQGRTYKNIGYEWTEYIAQLDESHAVSIGIVRGDLRVR